MIDTSQRGTTRSFGSAPAEAVRLVSTKADGERLGVRYVPGLPNASSRAKHCQRSPKSSM
jgi:hypothetical protein